MAKNEKLKKKIKTQKEETKQKKRNGSKKVSKKEVKKDSKVKKKEVKTNSDKVNSALKEKTKKVFKSSEKPKKVKKQQKSETKQSQTEIDKLKEYEEFFMDKNVAELKSILKRNNQVLTGAKNDLVRRCAQGKLWGALPNCSNCFGGKLRYNMTTGEYSCPGYMNDTEFIFCKFRAVDGIVRNEWID
jgi:hypothetical protein